MRNLYLLFFLLSFVQQANAQRITAQYNNVSFSEALKDLNARQDKYAINFVYDELEDFKVSKSIENMNVPDAVMYLIGFYPIKMTQVEDNIMVECTQKSSTKMIGRVIDIKNNPIELANVALLNVRDSSLINGGVTNEDGQFVIPCKTQKTIVRVSCVGYQTTFQTYSTGVIGAIMLHESTINLRGVKVNAMRQNIKMGREGMVVEIEHSDISRIGTATDVLREIPRVDVSSDGSVSVFAKGTPLIYINNRQVRDINELHQLKSDNIKSIEIVTAPGAKYDASVKAVIRIRTIRRQGEGWSGESYTAAKFNKWWGASQHMSLTYRTGNAEVFGELWGLTTPSGEDNILSNEINGAKNIFIEQAAPLN